MKFSSPNPAKEKFELSEEFGNPDDRMDEPDVENTFASFGDFVLVGHGKKTNQHCGTYYHFDGCLNVHLHNIITLDGKDYRGKVYIRIVHHSCDKPSCPVCYKHGWAVREAGNVEMRVLEAGKKFGQVEHIVASVPVKDYGLSMKALRANVIKVLKRRGVLGGVLIFHGFRYNVRKNWYWSPHFHCLGFILGGFRKCRRCPYCNDKGSRSNCSGCAGFYGVSKKYYKTDGYIVEVMGKRKTIFGTAWYQLNHSSIKKNTTRFHVATWFGSCSYRKLKVTVEYKKRVCPLCKHELVKVMYVGASPEIMDLWLSTTSNCKKIDRWVDYKKDGCVLWVEDNRRSYHYSG